MTTPLSDFPVPAEFWGKIYYPSNVPAGSHLPVLVFLHGRHVTCEDSTAQNAYLEWPCNTTAGHVPIPSFTGYDYLGNLFASQGFVVISISANAINAFDNGVSDRGMLARAELIQYHLNQLKSLNDGATNNINITALQGHLDFNNIGTMGHSRGGEGVIRQYAYNQSISGSPFTIKAIVPMAPTDFFRGSANNVAIMPILPYCDGDLADLQGVHYYDDVRYNVSNDQAAKHYLLVMGGNHNYYNTVWTSGYAGAEDDWELAKATDATDEQSGDTPPMNNVDSQCSPTARTNRRLTPAQEEGTAVAYMSAFYRFYLMGQTQFAGYLTGATLAPASANLPAGYNATDVFMSYHPAAAKRTDINTEVVATDLTTDTVGGVVTEGLLIPYKQCGNSAISIPSCLVAADTYDQQPHAVDPASGLPPGANLLDIGWTAIASWNNAVPAAQGNVTRFNALQVRVAVNFSNALDENNLTKPVPDFHIVLKDSAGNQSNAVDALTTSLAKVLYYPPGNTAGFTPKAIMSTLRIPLSAFTGVDKTNIRNVIFKFDKILPPNLTLTGAILASDLAFVSDPTP